MYADSRHFILILIKPLYGAPRDEAARTEHHPSQIVWRSLLGGGFRTTQSTKAASPVASSSQHTTRNVTRDPLSGVSFGLPSSERADKVVKRKSLGFSRSYNVGSEMCIEAFVRCNPTDVVGNIFHTTQSILAFFD